MTDLIHRAQRYLDQRALDKLFRSKTLISKASTTELVADGKAYINFSSNDYLSLAADFDASDLVSEQASSGATSSPLVIGNASAHAQLLDTIREFLDVPESHDMLLFSSGFSANQAVLNTVMTGLLPGSLLLQDKLNHASLLDCGFRLDQSGTIKQRRFKHNDLNDLTSKIQPNALVVTEGVFSMDGDEAPLQKISSLCRTNESFLMVDDAHGFGFETSSIHRAGISFNDIDFYVGTFGKAIGAQGAVVIMKRPLVQYFENFCKEYIYSTHLSPIQAIAVELNIKRLMTDSGSTDSQSRLTSLKANIKEFRTKAQSVGLNLLPSKSAIQPVLIGDEEEATQLANRLREQGIWVNAMRYPTVAKGQARLRVTLSANHKVNEINELISALSSSHKSHKNTPNHKLDLPKPQNVARQFDKSVATYKKNAQLQFDCGQKLLDCLAESLSIENSKAGERVGLDLGCGPGLYNSSLQKFADQVVSLDLSRNMLGALPNDQAKICADSHHLPILSNSVDWVYSNLMVQWCDLETVLSEIYRVLKPGGQLVMSTLLPGSLRELEQAWRRIDHNQHIHCYQSVDEANKVVEGLAWQQAKIIDEPRVYWFASVLDLAKELKGLGANLVDKRNQKGLMGKSKWASLEQSYRDAFWDHDKQAIPATYEVRSFVLQKRADNG